jgi:hypothetical protein
VHDLPDAIAGIDLEIDTAAQIIALKASRRPTA